MFLKPDYNLKNIYEIDFQELKEQGFITVAGKLPRAYLAKKYYGFDCSGLLKEGGND